MSSDLFYDGNGDPIEWWDPVKVLGNDPQFRGVTIQYHAYTNGGTRIGEVIWSKNYYDDTTVVHTEAGGGNNESEWDVFYNGMNWVLGYSDSGNNDYTVMIQWTAKLWYANEWGC